MTRCSVLLLLIIGSFALSTQAEDTEENVVWLNWPVTGSEYTGVDTGILMPSDSSRFSTQVQRDVIIGLRSDGTVVWKAVSQESPEQESIEPKTDDLHQ